MAYYTGSLSSCASLATLLTTQCVANGWALTGSTLSKGISAVTVASSTNYLTLNGALNASGSLTPTTTNRCLAILSSDWPVTYHLFINANPDTVVLVVNYGTLYIQYLMFGDIVKIHPSAYVGGNFLAGTSSTSFAQSPILPRSEYNSISHPLHNTPDILIASLYGIGVNTLRTDSSGYFAAATPIPFVLNYVFSVSTTNNGAIFHAEIDGGVWAEGVKVTYTDTTITTLFRGPNLTNAQTTLVPMNLQYAASSSLYMYLGYVEHVRLARVDNYNIADIITITPDQWMIFPWRLKSLTYRNGFAVAYPSTTDTITQTGTLGFAVRYTP